MFGAQKCVYTHLIFQEVSNLNRNSSEKHSESNKTVVHTLSCSSLFPLDCGCMYRGATGCPTVERPRHPGADAWSQSVSTTVHQYMVSTS